MNLVNLRTGSIWLWFSEMYLFTVTSYPLFSSIQKMESLYRQENNLFFFLESFIASNRMKLDLLERKYEELKRAKPQEQSAEHYISQPVNSFTLVRRMTLEWPLLLNTMADRTEIPDDLKNFPSQEDFVFSLRTVLWLQSIYKFSTADFVEGIVNGHSSNSRMTALDCFEMGKYSYQINNFDLSSTWFQEALTKASKGDLTVSTREILPYLFLASTFSGCSKDNQTKATRGMLTRYLAESPDFVLSAEQSGDFSRALARNCSWVNNRTNELVAKNTRVSDDYAEFYSDLCRGRFNVSVPNPKCYYVHYNNPRLLLAPFKLEEIYLEPPIVMLHDVIYDDEIEEFKSLFFKYEVSACLVGGYRFMSHRLCEVNWMPDNESETAARISRRVADMTDLHGESQDLQMARYGLGGEFRQHMDSFINESLSPEYPKGNRLATVMFYLNDVESGGRTVFPDLNVAVTPKKGSALYWFNIDHKGEDIQQMLHAGCPVLKGHKIVLNKWLMEKGQDPVKTCPSKGKFPRKHLYL